MKKIISFILPLLVAIQLWGQDTIEVVNIENQAVRDYMEDAWKTYGENPDYRVSVITQYNSAEKYGSDLDRPRGKQVQWIPTTTAENIEEVRITVSENSDYSDAHIFYPAQKGDSSFVICNLLPNCIYFYKVEEFLTNGTMTEMVSGEFRTVGQVRMIQVPNCRNIRDLGGWPTQYGVPVKYGRLYRSGSLDRVKSEGRKVFVDDLNVLAELDLRHEVKHTSSFLGSDKDYLRISHEAYMKGMTQKNSVYVDDLVWIIDRMKENKGVDWHCAIGCDRCGTLSFLIEGLLGVSELDLCRDYELSTFSLSEKNKRVRSPLKSMLDHIRKHGPKDDLAQCFYNYWLSIGMKEDDLSYFLQEMLDDGSDASVQDSIMSRIEIYKSRRAEFFYENEDGTCQATDSTILIPRQLYASKPSGDGASASSSSSSKPVKYRVKKGDTLSKIAKKYGTTVDKLKKLNHLKSDMIREGQVLTVKSTGGETTTTKTKVSSSGGQTKTTSSGGQTKVTHTIKKGETLGGIANRYHVTVSDIKRWNNLKSDRIVAGEKLIIYKK